MKLNPMQKWEEQQRLKLMSKKIAGAKSVLRSRCLPRSERADVLQYIHKCIVNTPDLEYLMSIFWTGSISRLARDRFKHRLFMKDDTSMQVYLYPSPAV